MYNDIYLLTKHTDTTATPARHITPRQTYIYMHTYI